MIQNFDRVRDQLKDLADVINAFKSEAVQLRIVDLIFGIASKADDNKDPQISGTVQPSAKKKNRPKTKASASNGDSQKKKPTASGQGPMSILGRLLDEKFFDTPHSIKSIIEHCEINLAKKMKQSDISGKLARMVRDGTLKRTKNSDGQYEYTTA